MNKEIFEREFSEKPAYQINVPSRVNLIGEHMDYFESFVLPMAIQNVKMLGLLSLRDDSEIHLYSENLSEAEEPHIQIDINDPRHEAQWVQYIQGAVAQFKEMFGEKTKGFNLLVDSTIPIGGGLSSSSALTMTAVAALALANGMKISEKILSKEEIAEQVNTKDESARQLLKELCLAGCRAEWWYGTNGGAMDHFAVTVAKVGTATLLDNRHFTYEYVPVPKNLAIIVCNTNVKHNQLFSGFAERKEISFGGFKKIKALSDDDLKNVRDLELADLKKFQEELTELEYRRLLHPVTEKERVFAFAEALKSSNFEKVGEIINEAFLSERDNYEISCEEVNIMQEAAAKSAGCFGARMTGGGFGGCVVAFVDPAKKKDFMTEVAQKYDSHDLIKSNNIKADIWEAISGDGLTIEKFNEND